MTAQEIIDQRAAIFKARTRSRAPKRKRPQNGHSGPLSAVFLPCELVDDIDAAINEAFEHIEIEQVEVDEQSII